MSDELDLMQEKLRLRIETMCNHRARTVQIRWLIKYLRSYVTGAEVIDLDAFTTAMMSFHFIGVRALVAEFFDKFADTEGEDAGLINISAFANLIVSQSLQNKLDSMRRDGANHLGF